MFCFNMLEYNYEIPIIILICSNFKVFKYEATPFEDMSMKSVETSINLRNLLSLYYTYFTSILC